MRDSRSLDRGALLEEAIREDPEDEARWNVFEDWLLEQGGKRAELLAHEKAGRKTEAGVARNQMRGALYGKNSADFARATAVIQWRAGFARDATFELPSDALEEAGRWFAEARAFSVVSRLHLVVPAGTDPTPALVAIGHGALAGGVRELVIDNPRALRDWCLDAGVLAPFRRLTRLAVRYSGTRYAPNLESISSLELRPGSDEELAALLDGARFEGLRRLTIHGDHLSGVLARTLAPILSRQCATGLTSFELYGVTEEAKTMLLWKIPPGLAFG